MIALRKLLRHDEIGDAERMEVHAGLVNTPIIVFLPGCLILLGEDVNSGRKRGSLCGDAADRMARSGFPGS